MSIDELELLRNAASRFCDEHAPPSAIAQWREDGIVPPDFWRAAGAAGLVGASIPQRYGGAGGDLRHELVINEVFAEKDVGDFALPVSILVSGYILAYGTEEQKIEWLPRLTTGEMVTAVAMTEPGAGSDLKGLKTRAVRDGDDYVIRGQKAFITAGRSANLVIVVCKTGEIQGAQGLSLIAVEKERAGFTVGPNLKKIGLRGMDTVELFFEDVRVPASNLVGSEGGGFVHLMEQLPKERLLTATIAVARMWIAIRDAVDYVKLRSAFNKKVFDFQNTQFELAECATEASIAQVFLDHCIEKYLEGELDTTKAAMAKYWITDLENNIIDRCLQLFGGYGYMTENRIARLYQDSRVQRIYGGTNEIMKTIIARSL